MVNGDLPYSYAKAQIRGACYRCGRLPYDYGYPAGTRAGSDAKYPELQETSIFMDYDLDGSVPPGYKDRIK
jgi:hypothetical protein